MRQDELALAAGVSTRAIHQIENGKPTSRLDTIFPVLAALGLKFRIEWQLAVADPLGLPAGEAGGVAGADRGLPLSLRLFQGRDSGRWGRPDGEALGLPAPARGTVQAERVGPVLRGPVPEGAVRATIAGKLGISEANGFDMLRARRRLRRGGDGFCPRINRLGRREPQLAPSAKPARRAARDLPRDPLGIDVDPGGVRLSLGGVQDKLILVRLPNGDFAQPIGGMPSNCLLKPEHERFEGLAVNEAFCMKVAAAAGNETARTELLELDGIRCLYSERFDRTVDADGAIVRLHQEDMCQALGLLPTQKYEAEGGPSVASVISLLRRQRSSRIALDVNAFVRAVLTASCSATATRTARTSRSSTTRRPVCVWLRSMTSFQPLSTTA